MRDNENYWFGLTLRARVIVYANDRIKKHELSTYEDLANPKWKGRLVVRSSNNIYNQSLLASLINKNGSKSALKWAKAVRTTWLENLVVMIGIRLGPLLQESPI